MKVYISDYRDRWISKIHTNYMNRKYGYNEWEDNTDWFEKLLEKCEDVLQLFYNATINRILDERSSQKIEIRIDRWDTWSMDHTLAHIIVPMLVQLNKTKQGAPHVDDEDVPTDLRSTSAPELSQQERDCGHVDENHFKRWDWVLGEMIWAFEQKTYDWEEQYTTGEYDFRFEKIEEGEYAGYSQMIHGPNHTAETDWEARSAHQERMTNGYRLFGKYYEALWN